MFNRWTVGNKLSSWAKRRPGVGRSMAQTIVWQKHGETAHVWNTKMRGENRDFVSSQVTGYSACFSLHHHGCIILLSGRCEQGRRAGGLFVYIDMSILPRKNIITTSAYLLTHLMTCTYIYPRH
jgi:hypothetical protein